MSAVCHVGYALNPKKMRRSGVDNTESGNSRKKWKGGGLADILSDQVEEGVCFEPYNFDIPVEDEVNLSICKFIFDLRIVALF
jgi:hypothetical protein